MLQYKRSSELFHEAQQVLPGGVNSPVRAFNAVGGNPIFVEYAKGAYLYDADGNKLIDYIASWGPLLFGHAYAPVIEAVTERAKRGTSFGMPTEVETEIAQKALSMVPNVDKIRFVNRILSLLLQVVGLPLLEFLIAQGSPKERPRIHYWLPTTILIL